MASKKITCMLVIVMVMLVAYMSSVANAEVEEVGRKLVAGAGAEAGRLPPQEGRRLRQGSGPPSLTQGSCFVRARLLSDSWVYPPQTRVPCEINNTVSALKC
ncbi:hypothetical protein GOP47_0027103 [Adiantum capillus-veneris]|nr:hypothetical protein GOP47_0027103 [Adiantum capillus-veneris]